jgi:hypothetical protein
MLSNFVFNDFIHIFYFFITYLEFYKKIINIIFA